jgi:adenosylhomocysteine nucleosidase
METVGILAAMSQERDALLRFVHDWERTDLGPFRCDRFSIQKRFCLLVTSGMGSRRAAQAAELLITSSHPQLLVSVGVAGAVFTDLQVGDVVAARNTCSLEAGWPGPLQPLALLSDAAWQAAEQVLQKRKVRLFSGTAVTTRGSQSIQHQPAEMINPVLEMETTGIASVALEHGLPLLSLRAISDSPAAPIPFDLEEMLDEQDNLRMGEIVRLTLRHPVLIPRLIRMGRNTTQAAENAALALVAALNVPAAVIF